MLYISIGLFISGVTLLLYALVTGSVQKNSNTSTKEKQYSSYSKQKAPAKETENILEEDEIPYIDDIFEEEEMPCVDELFQNLENEDACNSQTEINLPLAVPDNDNLNIEAECSLDELETLNTRDELPADVSIQATLFFDNSKLINNENNTGIIDSSLEDYKNLRRIGKGRISLTKDGINFYIDKKFFRFDFQRIDNLKAGDNYISVFLKKSSSAKLFIFENDRGFISEVNEKFSGFERDFT